MDSVVQYCIALLDASGKSGRADQILSLILDKENGLSLMKQDFFEVLVLAQIRHECKENLG